MNFAKFIVKYWCFEAFLSSWIFFWFYSDFILKMVAPWWGERSRGQHIHEIPWALCSFSKSSQLQTSKLKYSEEVKSIRKQWSITNHSKIEILLSYQLIQSPLRGRENDEVLRRSGLIEKLYSYIIIFWIVPSPFWISGWLSGFNYKLWLRYRGKGDEARYSYNTLWKWNIRFLMLWTSFQ